MESKPRSGPSLSRAAFMCMGQTWLKLRINRQIRCGSFAFVYGESGELACPDDSYSNLCYSSWCYSFQLMHVYKTKWFARFAKREQLSNNSLREAVERAERGLIDADLGGGLIKQRVARPGKGKSGGYRTLVAYRSKQRAIFLYGFAKNERENVRPDELTSFRRAGEY
ncbi:MAG TPA: type II toxin-antitoxin system RelE/ParE family toxin [Terracidiphilus sp.]|nr:type II toxin-antitoxin system RelE/ParE family toxin [Terracidiphilus sp.]